MQNSRFLEQVIEELNDHYANVSVIEGDRYCPVLAIEIKDFEPPTTIIERQVDLMIPLARCSGYFPDAKLAGIHVNCGLHSVLDGHKTLVPFCDPVEDTSWMDNTHRFYPYYENERESLIGSYYLCLNEPRNPPTTPLQLMELTEDYLQHWSEYALTLASQHGAIARGVLPGDPDNSADWVEHLIEHVSDDVKAMLLEAAHSIQQ